MSSLPLHPAIVHIPLGLAFVIPLLAVGFAWAVWHGRVRTRAWVAVVLLQAMLFGAALAATNTGEREEDKVESIVPHSAIELHEQYAEQFVWAAGATLVLAGLVLVVRRPEMVKGLIAVSVLGTLLVGGAAIRVGHAGGRLVYVHNAGAAYAPEGVADAGPGPAPALQQIRRANRR